MTIGSDGTIVSNTKFDASYVSVHSRIATNES